MRGYNVIDPAGRVQKLWCETEEEKRERVNELLEKWDDYINRNWISPNASDKLSPERKVKSFLDGLGYFLLMGNGGDIVTDYKEVMNGKREIPISSCPPSVQDALYGTGADPETGADDTFFALMTEALDEKADKLVKPKPKKKQKGKKSPKQIIKSYLANSNSPYSYEFCTVDTDNNFKTADGTVYHIDNSVEAYRMKRTAVGMLYDMDKIIHVVQGNNELWFDMNYELLVADHMSNVIIKPET